MAAMKGINELFILTDRLSDFECRRTRMKGYDAVVTAILLRGVVRAGGDIESLRVCKGVLTLNSSSGCKAWRGSRQRY